MNCLPNRFAGFSAALVALLLWTGCVTTSTSPSSAAVVDTNPPPAVPVDDLRVDDLITIIFSGVPVPPDKFEQRIKDDGTISLELIGAIKAAGKTAGKLQIEIHDAYVPKYFVRLNVSVHAEGRYFYVDGCVKIPSRQPHQGELTVLKAIAAAGGFTDFANKKKVVVVRANGQKLTVDCVKALKDPKLDLPIYPGDKITVPQRFL